ncbi:MAG: DUF2341 domain-containing protein [Chitinivibrionales bacterium]
MKQTHSRQIPVWLLSAVAAMFIDACTYSPLQLSGGGSDTEVSGMILAADGATRAGVVVALIPLNYDPVFDGNLPSKMIVLTDANGKYRFDSLNQGVYNLQAELRSDGTKILVNSIAVDSGKINTVPDKMLKKTATLDIVLPDSLINASGFITMPGTLLSKLFTQTNGIFRIDSVPQGVLPSIQLKKTRADSTVLFRNVAIDSSGIIVLNSFNAVTGRTVALTGQPVPGATIALVPSGYNPAFDAALSPKYQAVSDSFGEFNLYNIEQGVYNVYAVSQVDGNKALIDSIIVGTAQVVRIPDDTLKKPATLVVWLPDSLTKYSGYMSISGTFFWKTVQPNTPSVEFDSVPQGKLTSIVFQQANLSPAIVLFHDVVIASSDTIKLTQWGAWLHSAKVLFNTTASGANISQNVLDFPVLVRLNSGNFNFKQARPNGEDMRFLKTDNSALAFEIEDWDSATATATIWVKCDTVYGNDDTRWFTMLWGNPSAKTASNSAAVFDTANGFQGVWHLGQSGPNIQKDATLNHFDGTPTAMTGSSDVAAVIARGLDFDGSSQCVTALNARNSRLDVQTDSFYTVSTWVYARTLNNGLHVFLSKGSAQYGLMVNKQNYWEFYGGLSGYGVDTTTTAPATANVWTLITGVRNGMKQYLYVNGMAVDSTLSAEGANPNISSNFYDLVIGRQSDDQSEWFDGIVDEARVENNVRSPEWIRLCYQNQRSDQIMVQVVTIK